MVDNELLDMFEKYTQSSLELEKLKKELKQTEKNIKSKLLYSLSKKEKEAKLKVEGIRELRKFCQNADDKDIKELWDMLKEVPKTAEKSIYISIRQETIYLKGKMEQSKEKEESTDEKEKRKGIPNGKEFEEKEEEAKDGTFINKKRNRSYSY